MKKVFPYLIVVSLGLIFLSACNSTSPKQATEKAPEKPAEPIKKPTVTTPPPAPKAPELKKAEPPAKKQIPHKPKTNSIPATKPPKSPELQPDKHGISYLLPPQPDTSRLLNNSCFINKWYLLGPFTYDNEKVNKNISNLIHQQFIPNEKQLNTSVKPPAKTSWQLVNSGLSKNPGEIDVKKIYGAKPAVTYAIAYLSSPIAIEKAILYTGSNGFIKIWLNGKLIHTYNREPREIKIDQDVIEDLNLKKGINILIVKTISLGGDKWSFFLRLTDKDGIPVKSEAKKQP